MDSNRSSDLEVIEIPQLLDPELLQLETPSTPKRRQLIRDERLRILTFREAG